MLLHRVVRASTAARLRPVVPSVYPTAASTRHGLLSSLRASPVRSMSLRTVRPTLAPYALALEASSAPLRLQPVSARMVGTLERTAVVCRPAAVAQFTTAATAGEQSSGGNTGGQEQGKGTEKKMGTFRRMVTMYGRIAIVLYLAVSAVDFLCCFLLVKAAGAEQVLKMEVWLKKNLGKYGLFPTGAGDAVAGRVQDEAETEATRLATASEIIAAEKADGSQGPTLATLALVAYGVHKLLTPLRAALTAMLLPPVAKRFGHITWLVGKKTVAATAAAAAAKAATGSKTAAAGAAAAASKVAGKAPRH
ncbi:hypothetical protein THASP1DRAFT_31017 [Thamnocephalis sphaerospora]|uniref:DUF1279 domain-containing protein n=1 Tax=Thamnocephalis sphaerospora TaxID=78915 RepID=A0A4P9XMQ2_9FUNG|nr:hypothetical protein THASP1DRAFT_31017 [Thamnocephalis sphaerospora]|eukprot:RKP07166.1 hypothetical protein THASP1DRAFT_31017 [Thamnocephalis sphaerospora]